MSLTRMLASVRRLLVLASLCASLATLADPPRGKLAEVQRAWTVEQGLPSNAVTALAQDADGLIWVATLAGLARFDGVNFVVYDAATHPQLTSDRFTTMKRTPDGALWLSNELYEVFRFFDGTFTHIKDTSVLSVVQAPSGWLAYGTTRGILMVGADGARRLGTDVIDERVLEIDWPQPDTLLALTDTQLIEVHDPLLTSARRTRARPFAQQNSGALLQRIDGRVLIGTRTGLYQLDREWRESPQTLLSGESVIALHSLDRESVTIATATRITQLQSDELRVVANNSEGLGDQPLLVSAEGAQWRVMADRIERHDGRSIQAPSRISDVLVDAEHNVWIATNAAGLMQYRPSDVRLLGKPEGLLGDNVYPLLATRDGAIWAATVEGGLQRLHGSDPQTWARVSLPFNAVWTMHQAQDGAIWIAGDEVCVFADGLCSQHGLPAAMQSQSPVRAVFEDRRGRIWVGSQWALWRREGGRWRMLSADEGTRPGRAARAFVEDGDDHLWLATNGDGVFEFIDGRRTRQITIADGLASNAVRALWRDHENGDLWAGTENRGLCRLRLVQGPLEVRCLGRANGLPSNGIHAIAADAQGRFWMNSNQGVFHVERADLAAVLAGERTQLTRTGVYSARNGLRSSEGNGGAAPAVATDASGNIWFPTQAGIAIFDPAQTSIASASITALIDRVRIGAETLVAPHKLVLPAPIRALTVLLSANSFIDAEQVHFRYRLHGFDDGWTEIGTQRELQLALLPIGNWSLQVQARNSGGQWPESSIALPLQVLPAWHERRDLRAAAALLLLLLTGLVLLQRSRRYRRRQRELEALVSARTSDLQSAQSETESALATVREQHAELTRLHRSRTEFAANISHELKTPLTLLTAPLTDHPDIAKVIGVDLLAAMRDSGQRMQRLLGQLADLHLIDSAALQLQLTGIGLNAFVARCVLPFAALAEQRDQVLATRLGAPDAIAIDIDVFQFEKVLGNLLSNAIKFTPVSGQIRVSTAVRGAEAVILVEDSGEGVAEPHRRAVFERFYQVDGSFRRSHEGSGIGLALAREIVLLHGGSLHYAPSDLGGAGFCVQLPVAQSAALPAPLLEATSAIVDAPSVYATFATALPAQVDGVDRPRVLLVEDQEPLRVYLRSAFADRYEVLEAGNGRDGLQIAASMLPDVIISDVMMPLMDGVQMARALRADAATRCIPLLFLTAVDGEHARIAGLLAGGDHYLTKPFSAQVVRAHVDALLRGRHDLLASLKPVSAADVRASGAIAPSLRTRAEAIIRARLDDAEFDLDALVLALATSRSQLHRRLQAEHGISPGELITRTRLNAAAELLAAGRGSVTEVCYSVGFLSLGSFSRAFKNAFACNPSEYTGTL